MKEVEIHRWPKGFWHNNSKNRVVIYWTGKDKEKFRKGQNFYFGHNKNEHLLDTKLKLSKDYLNILLCSLEVRFSLEEKKMKLL